MTVGRHLSHFFSAARPWRESSPPGSAGSGSMKHREQSNCNALSSWTPQTTRLLKHGGSTAWDVLDHAMTNSSDSDATFTNALRSELEESGLLDTLKAARTMGEINNVGSPRVRGDFSTFVSRQDRQTADFARKHVYLSRLIQSIETTAERELGKVITIDRNYTSVQVARYPGDGKSGYRRHCDRGGDNDNECREEIRRGDASDSNNAPQRVVTAVYYVTPSDWSETMDGGCLRLYDRDGHYDVVPYSNRLVVFRSDRVSHEVLPSLRRDRMAITVWLYGWIKKTPQNPFLLAPAVAADAESSNEISTDQPGGPPPLPIRKATTNADDKKKTIFVSIASYCDSELLPTLISLFESARYPERIYVGVVWQVDAAVEDFNACCSNRLYKKQWFSPSQIRVLTMHAQHAQGPCYARYLCQSLWRDEQYVLQIDSHMRFRNNWDSYLVEQLESLPEEKCMLTSYPVGYALPNEVPNEVRGTLLVPWKFDENGMLRQRGRLMKERQTCTPCHLYAAGFNFARSQVLWDVPYDNRLNYLFFGEELYMAVRLYTFGYNLYAPPESVCYHLWSRRHRPTCRVESPREAELKRTSLEYVKDVMRGKHEIGSHRTVLQFQQVLGVDFEAQTIEQDAENGALDSIDFAANANGLFASIEHEKEEGAAALDPKAQALIASFLGL